MANIKSSIKKEELKATREGFSEGLLQAAKTNSKVYAVTADLALSVGMSKFSEEYPLQFVDVGVAEQNLVTVASGLAMGGKIPFAASFAVFSPGRNWEQIRTTIAYNNRGVIIVGSHVGLGVGEDGATHQALEDVALMRVMPNMQVIVPCDSIQAKKATIELAKNPKPSYLRIFRQKTPIISTEDTEFKIGKVQVLREGKDVCILSNGPIICTAIIAAEELKKYKISCSILNVHTVKPLDEETILKYATSSKMVVVIEDHQVAGGLGGAIAELLSSKYPKKILFIGVNDSFGESGLDQELYKKYKLDSLSIVKRIKEEFLSKKLPKKNEKVNKRKSTKNRVYKKLIPERKINIKRKVIIKPKRSSKSNFRKKHKTMKNRSRKK
ncbi:MAG: transketolase family protein [Candidatus Nanoarchaeia archaeon]